MNSKWFYAWLRLKHAKEDMPVDPLVSEYETDCALFESLVAAIAPPETWKPNGDGKFSKLKNYVQTVVDQGEFVKLNWKDADAQLTDLLGALLLGFEFVDVMIRKIEKAP